jgi:L-lactate utilization protein LutC/ferredoxin
MLYCIRCGACLNACPVFREIGGHAYVGRGGNSSPYPGPMGSVLSPALFGQAEFGQLARASTLCGACREACPVDIDLPGLLLRVRAGMTDTEGDPQIRSLKPNPPGWLAQGLRLFTWAAANPGRFRLAQKLAGLVAGGKGWLRLPAWSGWGLSKDFPRLAKNSFQEQWKKLQTQRGLDGETERKEQSQTKPGATLSPVAPVRKGIDESSLDERLEKLQLELEALGARYIQCARAELAEKVLELLREREEDQEILAWDGASLPEGLVKGLEKAGIRLSQPTAENAMQAAHIRVGLTGAIAAAAETGSLAIPGGAGRPLAASLLPEVHIVLLEKGTVMVGLDELLRLPEMTQSAAAVLVSGPSRTADIEMTLTIGVHGPGELIVLCY